MSGWGWDSLRESFGAASSQAQAAASQASKFAEVVSAQMSESGKQLAQQASTYSAAAAERAQELSKAAAESATTAAGGARERLAGFQLPEALAKLHLPSDGSAPSNEQLAQFAITPEFCDFVRSLTYSTFRDFPQDELDRLEGGLVSGGPDSENSGAQLNPWQAQHATLVCLAVREMNELRFVLVPKRLRDEQFWAIYFQLTKSRLPPEAFDLSLQKELLDAEKPRTPKSPKAPLFKKDMIRPAARAAEGEEEEGKGKAWLRNLVCGFEVEVPVERIQQETVVLGTIHDKFQQLSEKAKGLHVPESLQRGLSSNLNQAREFMGIGRDAGAARQQEAACPELSATPQQEAATQSHAAAAPHSSLHHELLHPSDRKGKHKGGDPGAASAAGLASGLMHAVGGNGGGRHADGSEHSSRHGSEAGEASEHGSSAGGGSQAFVADPDLEAYLQEMGEDGSGGSGSSHDSDAASLDEGDFDKYLNELSASGDAAGSEAGSQAGSGSEVDLDEWIDKHESDGGGAAAGSEQGQDAEADEGSMPAEAEEEAAAEDEPEEEYFDQEEEYEDVVEK